MGLMGTQAPVGRVDARTVGHRPGADGQDVEGYRFVVLETDGLRLHVHVLGRLHHELGSGGVGEAPEVDLQPPRRVLAGQGPGQHAGVAGRGKA